MSNTWEIPRESTEFVGPITVTGTVDGVVTTFDQSEVSFAVLPVGERPTSSDWTAAVAEPGGTGIGVQADPVTTYQQLGIWCKVSDSPNVPVLDPDSVGYLTRT